MRGHMHHGAVAFPDKHSGASAHGGVNGVGTQAGAVDGVGRVGDGGADDVAGVNVFHADFHLFFLEIPEDGVFKKDADVMKLFVPPFVEVDVCFAVMLLAGSFGDDDHGVMTPPEAGFQVAEESVGAVQIEGDFRNEDEVGIVGGQRGVGGNKAGFTAHQFDQPDAVVGAFGFFVGAFDNFRSAGDGGVEAEGFSDVGEVVVNGFGDADNGHFQFSFFDFFGDFQGTALGSVSADGEEDVQVQAFHGVDNARDIGAAPRRSEVGAPELMDVVHDVRREFFNSVSEFRVESFVTVGDAGDAPDIVLIPKSPDDGANNIVESGAESAAGDNPGVDVLRVKVDLFPGAGFFQAVGTGKLKRFSRIELVRGFQPENGGIIRDIIGHGITVRF